MTGESPQDPDPSQTHNQIVAREYVESFLKRNEAALTEAVAVAYPERQGEAPEAVFPKPPTPEARDTSPDPDWDDATTETMRDILGQFGVGRSHDESISTLGLPGNITVIVEAGQAHKIAAEVGVLEQDETAPVTQIIFTGSPNRKIERPEEQRSTERQLGKPSTGYTEYDVAGEMARRMKGFTPLTQPEVLEQSYTINNGEIELGTVASGQFVKLGTARDGAAVVLMSIDREVYTDEKGDRKYRQPQFGDVMRIVADSLAAAGENDTSIAFLTSSSYKMSRDAEALGKSLTTGRPIGVATYGTKRLAAVQGVEVPKAIAKNQIPSELHVAAGAVRRLREIVHSDVPQ